MVPYKPGPTGCQCELCKPEPIDPLFLLATKRVVELEDANRELIGRNEKLQEDNTRFCDELGRALFAASGMTRLQGEYKKLQKENRELKRAMELSESFDDAIEEKINNLRAENKKLKAKGVRWYVGCEWKDPLTNLKAENQELKRVNAELDTQWRQAEKFAANNLIRNEKLRIQVENLKEENAKFRNELDIARQTILHLDGWLKIGDKQVEALFEEKQLLIFVKGTRIKKLEKALTENEKIDTAHAEDRQEFVALLNDQINKKNARIDNLEEKIAIKDRARDGLLEVSLKLQQQRDVLYGNFFRNNFGNWQAKSLANSSLTIQGALTKIEAEKVRSM